MDQNSLNKLLSGRRFGHTVEYHEALRSTNARARDLAAMGEAEGTVVVANTQTGGHGRSGKYWADEPGESLLFSFVLRPRFPAADWPLVSIAAACASALAVRDLTDVDARTKWPNDLVAVRPEAEGVAARLGKLGGMMVLGAGGCAIVGVGVNVHSAPRLPDADPGLPAISIAQCTRGQVSRAALLGRILERFTGLYASIENGDRKHVTSAARELDITINMAVTLSVGSGIVSGVVEDIDAQGALVLRTTEGPRRFLAGEVSLSPTIKAAEVAES